MVKRLGSNKLRDNSTESRTRAVSITLIPANTIFFPRVCSLLVSA
jgi:hypothetical protein